jgi:hypothetical protein
VSYALENAFYQWQDGQRRVREAPELEPAVEAVVDELRRRLGSTFTLDELADLYGAGADWATDLAARSSGGAEATIVVDAAFARYAREAQDYAGGRQKRVDKDE